MIPIASEVFWGPMAYAIIGGLIVATLLTLLFLPALYVAWFRIQEPAKERSVAVYQAGAGSCPYLTFASGVFVGYENHLLTRRDARLDDTGSIGGNDGKRAG